MKYKIKRTAVITNDKLHGKLIDRVMNNSMQGLTYIDSTPEDFGYSIFTVNINEMSGDIPEVLNSVINEIVQDGNVIDYLEVHIKMF